MAACFELAYEGRVSEDTKAFLAERDKVTLEEFAHINEQLDDITQRLEKLEDNSSSPAVPKTQPAKTQVKKEAK